MAGCVTRGTMDACAPRWALESRSILPGLGFSDIELSCWFRKHWHRMGCASVLLGLFLCAFFMLRPWGTSTACALLISSIEALTLKLAAVYAEGWSSPPGGTPRGGGQGRRRSGAFMLGSIRISEWFQQGFCRQLPGFL